MSHCWFSCAHLPPAQSKIQDIQYIVGHYTVGFYNRAGFGMDSLIVTLDGQYIKNAIQIKFRASKNKVEYKAIISTLKFG